MAAPFSLPLLCMLFALSAASAAHSAPAPAVEQILQMADCLLYLSEGGAANKPTRTCCSDLKTVLKSDAQCLCEVFRSSGQFGVTLNMTRAVSLPAACHVNAPSVSNCGMNLGPSASPVVLSLLMGASTTGTGGTVAAPTPAPHGSGASASTTSLGLLVFTSLVPVISSFI